MNQWKKTLWTLAAFAGASLLLAGGAAADQVILDDLIVDGSICAGFDCVNGESFGFDTLRLKENNLRIKFQDTSTSASFPSNDWQITANDSSNGGQNKFSIDDIDGARTPFTIEAGARSHALYVDDGGRIGIGTSTPVSNIHVVTGNTPTLRLEQNGSSGFTPQTWDVAGNEANFFIRDATNGSTLPIRLRPGAPSSAIDIAATGNVGMGITAPSQALHIRRTANAATKVLVENTNTANPIVSLALNNNDPNAPDGWDFQVVANGNFQISRAGSGVSELTITAGGGAAGTITTCCALNVGGALTKASGAFKIDHPLDPENRYLQHSFVESPVMLNIYDGRVALDAEGRAVVALPEWFEALNRDYRYQLTPIGAPAPGLYVAREVADGSFEIAGGGPGQAVTWQLTGTRRDPYAEANRIEVEIPKPQELRGSYLYPAAYGLPVERGEAFRAAALAEEPEPETTPTATPAAPR